jgi:hypothetical protein
MIWTTSPLNAVVEVGIYSFEHAVCLGSRWRLDYKDTCPEILAEYYVRHEKWDEYTQIVERHETACAHMVAVLESRMFLAISRAPALEIAYAMRGKRLAQTLIDSF